MNVENAKRQEDVNDITGAGLRRPWSLLAPKSAASLPDDRVHSSANSLNALRLAFALVVVISPMFRSCAVPMPSMWVISRSAGGRWPASSPSAAGG
jgi:hypothetical protein